MTIQAAPVGNPKIEIIKEILDKIKAEWDQVVPSRKLIKDYWTKAVYFVICSTDVLITFVEKNLPPIGPDKKATVLIGISVLYDQIVVPLLPIWLKPFNSRIKEFIVGVIISLLVDWIVSKYNNGSWNAVIPPDATTTPPANIIKW